MSINLNNELNRLVKADAENDVVILRHLTTTKCICVQQPKMIYDSKLSASVPNKDYRTTPDPGCQNCEGSGWIFEEFLLKCKYFYTPTLVAHYQDYSYGSTNSNIMSFYIPISPAARKITVNDIIFQVQTDDSGNLLIPVTRVRKWIVMDPYELHLDNNKCEFMKVFAKPAVV